MNHECNLCRSKDLLKLIDFGMHPIAHDYLGNPTQDEYRHRMDLRFCNNCGLSQLVDPIPPDKLYTNYVTLSSWKNQPHIPQLITMIKSMPIKKDSLIVEVGSNDGTFSKKLMDIGYTNVLGVEPALDALAVSKRMGVKTIEGYFNWETSKKIIERYGQAKLIIARQMLEHVSDLIDFQKSIKELLSNDGLLLIEVPNFECNLNCNDYTLWEEHVNYFTSNTLEYFFAGAGIRKLLQEVLLFSGEAIIMTGRKVNGLVSSTLDYTADLKKRNQHYADRWLPFCSKLINYLKEHKQNGGRIAVYGAGARACSLINFAGLAPYIECYVDDQVEKQGYYMPGSKLPILPSDTIYKENIDLCLLAVNTECEDTVINKHRNYAAKGGKFYSVLPPSERLLPVFKIK